MFDSDLISSPTSITELRDGSLPWDALDNTRAAMRLRGIEQSYNKPLKMEQMLDRFKEYEGEEVDDNYCSVCCQVVRPELGSIL